MSKTVMRAFKMSEISAVDRPAQAHARAAIMKRHDVRKDMYQVGRFADVLSSISYLMQSAEYEAEREGDGSLVPVSLRGWLKSGSVIFQSMAAEECSELVAIVNKRQFSAKERESAANSGAALPDGSFPIENGSDLHNAMRAIGRAKDPAKAKAHIRSRAKALGLESELSDAFKRDGGVIDAIKRATTYLAESVSSILTSKAADKASLLEKTFDQFSDALGGEIDKALAAGDAATSDTEIDMDPLKKALGLPASATEAEVTAAITKALADAKAASDAVAKLTTDLAIAKAGMSDDEKSHHDGMKDDGEKEKFRGMSRDERKAKMAKRDDLPEHIRKALAEADDLKKRLAALEDKDELAALTKRATDVGMAEDHGAVIQKAYRGDKTAVDKLLDVVKALTAQVKAAGLFKELGDGRDGGGASNKAYDELVVKAETLRKTETGLTQAQAFAKVYSDPANADIVKRERIENRPQAA
jgi:hypothetical protein